jgi:hypothetical protein
MPTATNTHTTPTRRSALGFSVAAIIAGMTTPVLAGGAGPNADAELTQLCTEFLEIDAQVERLDNDAMDRIGVPLLRRLDGLLRPIAEIPACTDFGRSVKARAAIAAMRTIEEISSDELFALVRSALLDVAGSALA